MLEPRSKGAKPASDNKIGTGRGTLRLRAKGPATVEEEVRLRRMLTSGHKYRQNLKTVFFYMFLYFIGFNKNELYCKIKLYRAENHRGRSWK